MQLYVFKRSILNIYLAIDALRDYTSDYLDVILHWLAASLVVLQHIL